MNWLLFIAISVVCVSLARGESWGMYYTMMLVGVGVMFIVTREKD